MALSMNLRTRLLAAVDSGSSCRAAAAQFGVAPSTAVRWRAQQRETGDIAPKPRGGDMRSRQMEERAADILAIWKERRDITLEELRLALADQGYGRFRCRATSLFGSPWIDAQKKTGHAIEQDRPDVLKQRQDWFEGQLDLEPERRVFIDETGPRPI